MFSVDIDPGEMKDKARNKCTWYGREVVNLKKNVDHNPLYNPLDGSILHAYEPANQDHGVLATEVISAPDELPGLFASKRGSKRHRSPQPSPASNSSKKSKK